MTSTDTAQRLQQHITDGIAALSRDRQWVALLDLTARTGSRYSLGNLILIGAARPDATCVAGYGAWLKAGRQVRRGERGIRILAPIIARRPAQPDHDTPNDGPAPDHGVATGDSGTAQSARRGNRTGPARAGRVVGFRTVVVFVVLDPHGHSVG
jgi:hypothetical protein